MATQERKKAKVKAEKISTIYIYSGVQMDDIIRKIREGDEDDLANVCERISVMNYVQLVETSNSDDPYFSVLGEALVYDRRKVIDAVCARINELANIGLHVKAYKE